MWSLVAFSGVLNDCLLSWQVMRFCQSFMNEMYRYLGIDKVTSGRFHSKNIYFYIWKFDALSCMSGLMLYTLQDLPSEEMGVGTREMGYLFGQYRRLAGHFQVPETPVTNYF